MYAVGIPLTREWCVLKWETEELRKLGAWIDAKRNTVMTSLYSAGSVAYSAGMLILFCVCVCMYVYSYVGMMIEEAQ